MLPRLSQIVFPVGCISKQAYRRLVHLLTQRRCRRLLVKFPRRLITGSLRDPEVVADYRRDPLVFHGRCSARLIVGLLDGSDGGPATIDETPGAEVRLSATHPSGGGIEILVTDNGPGIPDETRAKLFEPFFTTKSNGTGLGLPIAKKLARALGGDLDIQPATPQGTRARLTLP